MPAEIRDYEPGESVYPDHQNRGVATRLVNVASAQAMMSLASVNVAGDR